MGVIPEGSIIYADAFAANRDPAVFPEPLAIRLDRNDARHLQFGYGMHNCMGAALARLEITTVLQILVQRFPNLRLAVPADQVPWVDGIILRRAGAFAGARFHFNLTLEGPMKNSFADTALLSIILLAIFVVPSSISRHGPRVAGHRRRYPGAVATSLQWVVNAFNLAFACFTLAWGALADQLGRKRCFVAGASLYVVASVLSAVADSAWFWTRHRGLAGIGAAAIFSCGVAILSTHFSGPARVRAFALFGTVAGLGVSLGPTLSGLLLDSVGWRAISGRTQSPWSLCCWAPL